MRLTLATYQTSDFSQDELFCNKCAPRVAPTQAAESVEFERAREASRMTQEARQFWFNANPRSGLCNGVCGCCVGGRGWDCRCGWLTSKCGFTTPPPAGHPMAARASCQRWGRSLHRLLSWWVGLEHVTSLTHPSEAQSAGGCRMCAQAPEEPRRKESSGFSTIAQHVRPAASGVNKLHQFAMSATPQCPVCEKARQRQAVQRVLAWLNMCPVCLRCSSPIQRRASRCTSTPTTSCVSAAAPARNV
jgi:hypothetical protein